MSAEPQRPVITKELLRELGDWRAEKEGRTLAANGNVLQWEYQPPFLSGTVRTGGGATINARIKLGTRATEVENLCVCQQARDKGRICAHVLALVYATILPAKSPGQPPAISPPPRARDPGLKHVPLDEARDESQPLELMVL